METDSTAPRNPFERGRVVGFNNVDRHARRRCQKDERDQRASGKWAPWEKFNIGEGGMEMTMQGHEGGLSAGSWMRDVHTVHRNGWCAVLVRTANTKMGKVQHLAIETACDEGLTWAEKQRIKNELYGAISVALEVFPAEDRLIDEAPMYHLWVLPFGFDLPFGLHAKDECSSQHYRP
jgi:hypothetical protein